MYIVYKTIKLLLQHKMWTSWNDSDTLACIYLLLTNTYLQILTNIDVSIVKQCTLW